jgi:hypothetical protein
VIGHINDQQGPCREAAGEGLLALAERCEKATGPDRELDGQIDRLLNTRPSNGDYDEHENAIWSVKDTSGLLIRWSGFACDSFCASAYTASLDAAVSLVPSKPFPGLRPGEWWWSVDSLGCDAHVAYENHDSGVPEYSGSATTPALALCAAALRARAQSGAAS